MRTAFMKKPLISLLLASLLSSAAALAQPEDIDIVQVRDNIYMLVGSGGGNVTVQTGVQGILVVDTNFAEMSDTYWDAITSLSDGTLRYIINTHHHGDHTGGNAGLGSKGSTLSGGNVGADITDAGTGAQIIAHENVLLRLVQDADMDSAGWPTSTYFQENKDLWFNGEGIRISYQPDAHTDGDSVVFFRQSDVIVAGDVFFHSMYPYIDVDAGGSIQGLLAAVNNIVDMVIPVYGQDGGTLIVPGHGRLADFGDILNYREMLTVIRDRIQAMIDSGKTLEEVLEMKPTLDYDPRWGANESWWTTEMFISTVYQNLSEQEN